MNISGWRLTVTAFFSAEKWAQRDKGTSESLMLC